MDLTSGGSSERHYRPLVHKMRTTRVLLPVFLLMVGEEEEEQATAKRLLPLKKEGISFKAP